MNRRIRLTAGLGVNPHGISLNHLVRLRQHRPGDRKAQCLRGFQVDHQLELGRLLDGQVGGACRHAGRGNSHDISWFRDLHEWKMQHGVSAYNDDHALMKATLDEKLRRMHVIAEKLEAKIR